MQALLMQSVAAAISGWNPADTHGDITLSNSNRTALRSTTSSGSWRSGRSPTSKSTGKWIFNVVDDADGSSNGALIVGLDNGSLSLSAYVGSSSGSYGFQANNNTGTKKYNNGSLSSAGVAYILAGGVAMVAVDFDAGKIWFGTAGGWAPGANPSTGAVPDFTFTPNTALYAAFSESSNPQQSTVQFTSPTYGASGFSPWG